MNRQVTLRGIGLIAPGLNNWAEAQAVLSGVQVYQPSSLPRLQPDILAPTERRRSSDSVKLALSVAQQACIQSGLNPTDLAGVFASSIGDPLILHQLCEELANTTPMVSPTRFHNSTHNAPAGYWSIATGATGSFTCIAAHDHSFAAAVQAATAQALSEHTPVLLACYDLPYPAPLADCRPVSAPFAVALVLDPNTEDPALGTLSIAPAVEPDCVTRLQDPALEDLRRTNPAARALPLLQLIAHATAGHIVLEQDGNLPLHVAYRPPC